MRYYKHILNDILDYIGTGDGEGIDITEKEYNEILNIIENKPADTETHYYVLKAGTLEYEAVERLEPIVIPPTEYQQGYDDAVLDMIEQGVL